jgi:NADPH:quinone reductase-like Zn-dependent oxidoreductase
MVNRVYLGCPYESTARKQGTTMEISAWATYVLAPATAVIPLPDAISDEVGCQLIAMPLSAMMLLKYLQLEWASGSSTTRRTARSQRRRQC